MIIFFNIRKTMTTDLKLVQFPSSIPHVNFYPDISDNKLEYLITQHKLAKTKIETLSDLVLNEENQLITSYFETALHNGRADYTQLSTIFNKTDAITNLNSKYWSMAMKEIQIEDFLPAKKRDEWSAMVQNQECPDFDNDTVYATLKNMLIDRDKYLAEKVEGIFNILSPEHVTNSPSGFGGKLIIYYDSNIAYLNDLRGLIAKFMNRDSQYMRYRNTENIIDKIYKTNDTGQWNDIDGGALQIKVYLKGTVHIKIHEDIVYKLNEILSFLYPNAIPSEFRKPKKAKDKNIKIINNLLSFEELNILNDMEPAYRFKKNVYGRTEICGRMPNTLTFSLSSKIDKVIKEMIINVLVQCGGVLIKDGNRTYYLFDYDFYNSTLPVIVRLGYVPNVKSHQYYPTPEMISEKAIKLLDLKETDLALEPQAGQGNLFKHLHENSTAVEISEIHCNILKDKFPNANIINDDFLKWYINCNIKFDKILMNPPYHTKQYVDHLNAALTLLNNNGICVAILPESAVNIKKLHGYEYEFSEPMSFDGVSISTIIVTIKRI